MTEWTLCRWHGPPAVLEAALRGLGWHGPEEEPAAAADPRIGGVIPPAGEAPPVIEGVAYAAIAARGPLPTPEGLSDTPPGLSAALIGSF